MRSLLFLLATQILLVYQIRTSFSLPQDGVNSVDQKVLQAHLEDEVEAKLKDEVDVLTQSPHFEPPIQNSRPIVAVLSQELSRSLKAAYGEYNYSSYIGAAYVKYVEMAGARVVPVLINQPDEYYQKIFNKTNGLLIPGGAASILDSGYQRAALKIWELALEAKDNFGDYYPIR